LYNGLSVLSYVLIK